MKANKENYWFMLQLLLLINVVLIAVFVWANSGKKDHEQNEEPCGTAKKINADILNSVTVKLM